MEPMIIMLLILVVISWGALMVLIFRQKQPAYQGRLIGLTIGFIGIGIIILEPVYKVDLALFNVSLGEHSVIHQKDILNYSNIHRLLNDYEVAQLDTIFINGIQHTTDDLDLLHGGKLIFNAARDTTGVIHLSIPKMTAFQQHTITGISKGIFSGYIMLPQQDIVEATFSQNDHFTLTFEAPPPGRYVLPFKLITLPGDTISEEIPILVNDQPVLNILTISSFPDFELNFLKNHWASVGYGFVQRIQISRDKFQTSVNNHPSIEIRGITDNLLSQFDVLHIDMSSWSELSTTERNIILKRVEQDGLGVLIAPNANDKKPPGIPPISLNETEPSFLFNTELAFLNASASNDWQPLIFEDQKIGYSLEKGFGKIVILNFVNSYKLVLNNQKTGYQTLWAELFSTVYNAPFESFQLMLSEPVIANRKTALSIIGMHSDSSYFMNGRTQQMVINDIPFIESLGTITVVPKVGWNEISDRNQKEWFYAFSANNWKLMQANNLAKHVQYLNHFTEDRSEGSSEEEKRIPWWAGLAIMILGFGALWLIEKWY